MRELESIFNELEALQGQQSATADRLKHEAEERKAAADAAADIYNRSVLDESVPVSVLAEYRVSADRAKALSNKAQAEYEKYTSMPGCINADTYSKAFKEIRAYYQTTANAVYKRVNKAAEGFKKDITELEQIHAGYMDAVKQLNTIVKCTHSDENCNSVIVDTGNLYGRTSTDIENELSVRRLLTEFTANIAVWMPKK